MNGVFISYVHEDDAIVESFCTALRIRGIAVWRDKDVLGAGDRWKREIQVAIQEGACFIACFSNNLNLRRRSYMYEELMIAVDELRQRSPNRAWFIPVRLSPCEIPEIMIGGGETLSAFHCIDLFQDWEDGVNTVARAIHTIQKANGPDGLTETSPRSRTLISELRSADPRDREVAVLDLRSMLSSSEEAKSALKVALLTEKDSRVVSRIVDALASVGDEILTDLFQMLDDLIADPLRNASGARAIRVLQAMGSHAEQAIPRLVAVLRSSAPSIDAVEILGKLGRPAIPALLELAADDTNVEVRRKAFYALAVAGEASAPAVPILVGVVKEWSYDYETVAAAAAALGKIRTDPVRSVPALAAATRLSSEAYPGWPGSSAVAALGEYGETAAPAVSTLIQHIESYYEDALASQAAEALGKIGLPSLGPLLDTLRNANDTVASRCAVALGMIGPGAYQSVPDLCRLADRQEAPSREIIEAIGSIGTWSDSVCRTLLRCLKSAEIYHWPSQFLAALSAAAKLGPRAASLLPEALKYIGENGAQDLVMKFAISAAEPAIPELIKIVEMPQEPRRHGGLARWNGTRCLAILATTYEEARRIVDQLALHADESLRYCVAAGIGEVGLNKRLDSWSLRLLNQLANDDREEVRRRAIESLPRLSGREGLGPALEHIGSPAERAAYALPHLDQQGYVEFQKRLCRRRTRTSAPTRISCVPF
jgi:HEAT repeat protein